MNKQTPKQSTVIQIISVRHIKPSSFQPRDEFDEDALIELADTIRSSGILQPITVRPRQNAQYELVIGERRLRAAKIAKLDAIPCIVREMSDRQAALQICIENFQREDLSPTAEAAAVKNLLDMGFSLPKLTVELGKTETWLRDRLGLLELPKDIQSQISRRDGPLNISHAGILLRLPNATARRKAADMIKHQGLNTSQLRARTQHQRDAQGQTRHKAYSLQMFLHDALAMKENLGALQTNTQDDSLRKNVLQQLRDLIKLLSKAETSLRSIQ